MFDIVEITSPQYQVLLLTHSRLPATVMLLIIPALVLLGWHHATFDGGLGDTFWFLLLLAFGFSFLVKLVLQWSTRKFTFDATYHAILLDHQRLFDFDEVLDLRLVMHVCADQDCDGDFGTYTLILDLVGNAHFVIVSCCDGAPICLAASKIARLLNCPLLREEFRYGKASHC